MNDNTIRQSKDDTPHRDKRSIDDIWGWTSDVAPQEEMVEFDPTVSLDRPESDSPDLLNLPEEVGLAELDPFADAEQESDLAPDDDELEEIDFWQGMDPDQVASNGYNERSELEAIEGEVVDFQVEELDSLELDEVAKEAAAIAASGLSPDGKKMKDGVPVVTRTRPRRKAEDYKVPVIPWLSQKKRGAKVWGYGFIIAILVTVFGSISLGTYLVLLHSKVSIPTIVVNVSIISLLVFLLLLVIRYVALIYMSFLHLSRSKDLDEFNEVTQQMKASILIPAYNEEKGIEASIKSMLELDYDNFEVIVINDGSKDETLEVARKLEGWHGNVLVKVISQRNLGKSNALNFGASVATGDVIVCVDGDSKLHPGTLKMAMRHFIDPKVGAVAGNVKVINRRNMLTNLQALEYVEGLNLVRRAQALIQAVNIVPGPIGLFRRKVIMDIGGWDDDTYAEDCDLTLKVLVRKWKIEYEPGAISYTEAPEHLLQLLKQRYRWTRGILQSLRKHSIHLINPLAGWRVMLTLWQMVFESVMWPLMNVTANLLFLLVAFLFGMSPLIVFWWVQLTILDTLAAMHTVAIERESIKLVPYAIIYRAFFIQLVDVSKLIATIEELMGFQMSWGHVERQGRLS